MCNPSPEIAVAEASVQPVKSNPRLFTKTSLKFLISLASSHIKGNVTDEVIMKYIEMQSKEPEDGNFKIDGEL